jgi:putative restriction endonuclease
MWWGAVPRPKVYVSILHTGRHYPDDLSDDGLIYHYPTTHRPPSRDSAEIQATKNTAALSLPIFVSKFESYGMLETAASRGWKAKDAIEWFHGIGRLGYHL